MSPNKVIWAAELSLFILVSPTGPTTSRVQTSPDGITWTTRQASEANTWNSIAWSPTLSMLVAVSSTGTNRVMTSVDAGVTWLPATAASATTWTGVVWADTLGLFVAVASLGTDRVMTSTNGTTWVPRSAAAATSWTDIVWSGSRLVASANAVGTQKFMYSDNGTSWTLCDAHVSMTPAPHALAWSSDLGLFAAVGPTSHLVTSPDGITWTDWSGLPSGWTGTTNNGQLVWVPHIGFVLTEGASGGSFSNVLISPDAVVWTTTATGVTARTWMATAYAPARTQFLAVSSSQDFALSGVVGALPTTHVIRRSADGVTWATVLSNTSGLGYPFTVIGNTILTLGGGLNTGFYSSTSGTSWTLRALATAQAVGRVIGPLIR